MSHHNFIMSHHTCFQLIDQAQEPYVNPPDDEEPKATVSQAQQQYNLYYRELDEKLVWQFPMKTFNKTKYAAGDKLELLPKGRHPPSRALSTVNAFTITSIATRLGQMGNFTAAEEAQQVELEKQMVRPSFKYGSLVNQNARPDPNILDRARQQQMRIFNALRDSPRMDEQSVVSGKLCLDKRMVVLF